MKFGCAFLFLFLCFCSSLVSCASGPATLHRQLVPVWREYTALPGKRALAIAGVPGRGPWVTAASGGHEAVRNAKVSALEVCAERRQVRRMQAECVLYAIGDRIVWRGR
ncbi:MAG: hypothetical protein IH973_13640 [Myxococcales bacterium]|nr:hypothetical protein [Myxococcales bacterium]